MLHHGSSRTRAAILVLVAALMLVNACSDRTGRGRHGMMPGGMPMSGRMPMMGAAAADTGAAPHPTAAPADASGTCPAVSQALVDRGRQVFSGPGNCFACHGPGATGTAAAPDLTDQQWLNIDGSYPSIIALVRSGVANPKQYPGPMPAMGGASLNDDQVCAVSAYVQSLAPR